MFQEANFVKYVYLLLINIHLSSSQMCSSEYSEKGIRVKWPVSPPATEVFSEPLCYYNNSLIRRKCNNTLWYPALEDLPPCLTIVEDLDTLCPPGYDSISKDNAEFCYKISPPSAWNHPCLNSGGASIITDLGQEKINMLLTTLNKTSRYKQFWLPAQRQKLFNPVVWYVPGPYWGRQVADMQGIHTKISMLKNCLLLDVEKQMVITESCNKEYPSICFYLNEVNYPAKCPTGYHAFRFLANTGICFGIEVIDDLNYNDNSTGLTFNQFVESKCPNPMIDGGDKYDHARFIFKKLAEVNNMSDNMWCWMSIEVENRFQRTNKYINDTVTSDSPLSVEGAVNKDGVLSLADKFSKLPCIACVTRAKHVESDLALQYDPNENHLYLTIYFPSGLWKYDDSDKGIQCFSDANGFARVVNVTDIPFMDNVRIIQSSNSTGVEKVVYSIDLITDRSAQYWCEGHTKNFSLLSTNKIVANPKGNTLHVYAIVIQVNVLDSDISDIEHLLFNITDTIFQAEKVLIMEILEFATEYMLALLHVHVSICIEYDTETESIVNTFNSLKTSAEIELPKYNATFVNLSSSIYCLPTTTSDPDLLDWEMTLIGHIAVPKQFCLQNNGLPVKRNCLGSYQTGGYWGEIEGICNTNHEPSNTTKYLYELINGKASENHTLEFLTKGLNFVLSDVDTMIPADVFYISMSLQQVLNIARVNKTSIEMGDIDNMAWIMDRITVINNEYLRLAQTLNSTNVILDSVNDLLEILLQRQISFNEDIETPLAYQLAVKPQFIIQISYPELNNITGLAVAYDNNNENEMFSKASIYPLYANSTIEEVLSIPNLEIATWLPQNLIDTLKRNLSVIDDFEPLEDIHVVINVFHNDAVFQQINAANHIINSRIVGVSVPGFVSNLEYYIPLIFKEIKNDTYKKSCGYWDFQAENSDNNPGYWSNYGCYFVKSINDFTICECYHLTNFGQLMNIGDLLNPDKQSQHHHNRALNIITVIGCFLSLTGVCGLWITAFVFQTWRKKAGTKVLLQLSSAIAMPLIFIMVFNLDNTIFIESNGHYLVADHMETICIILGAMLHYSILASFMWMLITASLQFIRYVRVLGVCRPSRFMIKFTLIGWGLPLVPVAIILAMSSQNYIPDLSNYGERPICYPNGFYLLVGLFIPVCIILLINVVLFISVIYAISRGPDGKMRVSDIDLVGAQLRVSIFLFFLLGLTWIFGIFSFSNNMLWSYLFCLTSTLQGFVLFVYFVICDPSTRNLWITLMTPQSRNVSSRGSITSISSG